MKSKLLLIVFLPLVFLSGCFDADEKSAAEFIQEVKQEKQVQVPPLPAIQEYKSVEYHAANLRNPFQAGEIIDSSANKKFIDTQDFPLQHERPDANRKREVLENYSLDSIVMVGVIRKGKNYWGIVKDKAGLIHRVQVGNYMGENSGYIEKITEQDIYLKETIADGQGGWVERKAMLSLAK